MRCGKKLAFVFISIILAACSTKSAKEHAQMYYLNGDYALAYEELFPMAKRGDPESQYTLAYMYYYGQGVAKNEDTARSWMRKSANAGNQRAKYALQLMLENGYTKYTVQSPRHPVQQALPIRNQYSSNNDTDINWIRQQNPEQFTLVLTSEDSKRLTKLLLKETNDNTRTVSYQYKKKGVTQQATAYGTYSTAELAESSKNKLDAELKKSLKLAKWEDIQNVMLP